MSPSGKPHLFSGRVSPDDGAKAKLRAQAVSWFKAELAVWAKLVESGPAQARASVVQTLQHWKEDTDLAGIRDAKPLEALPEAERAECRKLWAEVRRYLTERLGRAGKVRLRANAAKPKPISPPSPRQLSFDWIRRPENRKVEAQARLDTIRAATLDLNAALDLADEFTSLIRKQSTGTLNEWLLRAEISACPEVRNFAEGIRRDESAVNAAITTHWSNGRVEGHVNRLKMLKRQMFGRAGFTLLKARVVHRE